MLHLLSFLDLPVTRKSGLSNALGDLTHQPETFAQVMQLTPSENHRRTIVLEALSETRHFEQQALYTIPSLPDEFIFKMQFTEPFRQACLIPALQSHWKERLKRIHTTAANIQGMQGLVNRPNFDIFLSYYVFMSKYVVRPPEQELEPVQMEWLDCACRYQGFHALYQRADIYFRMLGQATRTLDDSMIEKCFRCIIEIGDLWAPGLSVAAKLWLQMGAYVSRFHAPDSSPRLNKADRYPLQYQDYLNLAKMNLYLAKMLEENESTRDRSSTACLAIFEKKTIPESYGLPSWQAIIHWLMAHYPSPQPFLPIFFGPRPETDGSALGNAHATAKRIFNQLFPSRQASACSRG